MNQEDKKRFSRLVAGGETAKAIEALIELLENSKSGKAHLSAAYQLSARYQKLMEEKTSGLLFKSDEEVLQNRINNDLLSLLDQIEKPARPKPAAPRPPKPAADKPQQVPQQPLPAPKSTSSLPWWLWALGVAGAIVGYLLFQDKPVAIQYPKICILSDLDTRCCPDNLGHFRSQEAGRQLVVSALLNKDLSDPYISGIVYDQNRNVVPMRMLRLTMNPGAICYSGLLLRTDGNWPPGRYTIEFSVNQKPAGSVEFHII